MARRFQHILIAIFINIISSNALPRISDEKYVTENSFDYNVFRNLRNSTFLVEPEEDDWTGLYVCIGIGIIVFMVIVYIFFHY